MRKAEVLNASLGPIFTLLTQSLPSLETSLSLTSIGSLLTAQSNSALLRGYGYEHNEVKFVIVSRQVAY